MNLLLDIGNSRLKWAWSDGGELIHHGVVVRDAAMFETLDSAWRQMSKPQRVVASNVADDEFGKRLSHWILDRWQLPASYVAVEQGWRGLEIAYSKPQLFGVDRWLALIAARHLYSGAVCVIDCGTAVTIDVLASDGKHLGGVIVPGIALMQTTLLQRSVGVNRGIDAAGVIKQYLLGRDTRSGIERGALYAVAGVITHTLARVKIEVSGPISSIITGGDAEVVLAELDGEYHHSPHLVLNGLQFRVER